MKVLYPGSFDPLTNGHVDLIERASQISEELYIGVLENLEKKNPFFSSEERVELIKTLFKNNSKIKVLSFSGLVVDLFYKLEIDCLIRGMRDIGDYRYEWEIAQVNQNIGKVETLFLLTKPDYAFISSSRIKEIIYYKGNVSGLVPPLVLKAIQKKTAKRAEK